MQRWEYLTRTLAATGAKRLQDRLAELGGDGWDLVAVLPAEGGAAPRFHTYVFKRPKTEPAVVAVARPDAAGDGTAERPLPDDARAA